MHDMIKFTLSQVRIVHVMNVCLLFVIYYKEIDYYKRNLISMMFDM